MGKRWKIFIGVVLGLILAAALLVQLFRIRSIEIVGNERYSAQQIRDDLMYDYLTTNTLYFTWKYRNAGPAEDAPYLESVQAQLVTPSSVRLTVTESVLTGRVVYDGQNVYFDSDGIVEEISDEVYDTVPLIEGLELSEPVLYQKLPLENTARLRTVLSISQLLIQAEMIPDSVQFDENGNMTLIFGSVRVRLGQDEYLEEKIANLVQIYPKVASQKGELNMEGFTGKNEAITFLLDDEPEEMVTEAATESAVEIITDDALAGIGAGTGTTDAGTDAGTDTGSGTGTDTPQDAESAMTAPTGETDASGTGEGEAAGTGEADASGTGEADVSGTGEADASGTGEEAVEEEEQGGTYGLDAFMVFDSSGTLRYDAHVVNGQVVDKYGNVIDGCRIDENGNVVDAYWNVIDPYTGTLAQ